VVIRTIQLVSKSADFAMKISYLSDLHLEFLTASNLFPADFTNSALSDVLILAGDIGYPTQPNYLEFLKLCSREWSKGIVLVIAGNHEFYTTTRKRLSVAQISESICAQCKEAGPNVHFLEKCHVDFRGIRFVGTTLWFADSCEPAHRGNLADMNDFRHIYAAEVEKPRDGVYHRNWDAKFLLQPRDVQKMNAECVSYLQDAVSQSELPVVCITHHPPIRIGSAGVGYYNTQLEHVLANDKVRKWIFGHAHRISVFKHHKLMSNTIGYLDEFGPIDLAARIATATVTI
jgi:predicted phosphohydrolase